MENSSLRIGKVVGRDKTSHKLVEVWCERCKSNKIMRLADAKRNKSCGCLKADTWHAAMVARKRLREGKTSTTYGNDLWHHLQEQYPHATPIELCQMGMADGPYVPGPVRRIGIDAWQWQMGLTVMGDLAAEQ